VIHKNKDARQKNEEVCAREQITWTTDFHSMTPKDYNIYEIIKN
jgi:hypothetical protein